jgi:hypothetical protein
MDSSSKSLSVHFLSGLSSIASTRSLTSEDIFVGLDKGWHLLQGLYDANKASLAVAKNSQFSLYGFLAGQVGLHMIPVVLTPTKNTPS